MYIYFRSETVVERMLSNWMSICLYQYLKVKCEMHAYNLHCFIIYFIYGFLSLPPLQSGSGEITKQQ